MNSNKLVRFPNGDYVNPAYVSLIELVGSGGKVFTKMWVVTDSGYKTKSLNFEGDYRRQLADLLNS